jgi:hypothetical protein
VVGFREGTGVGACDGRGDGADGGPWDGIDDGADVNAFALPNATRVVCIFP